MGGDGGMESAGVIRASLALMMASSFILPGIAGIPGDPGTVPSRCVAQETTEHSPPVAVASANPTTVIVGNKVTLDASASTDEYFVISWEWSYIVSNETRDVFGMIVIEMFNKTGTYVVWLTVRNCWGSSNTTSVTITVLPSTGPNSPPIVEAGPDSRTAVGQSIVFDGSMSSDDVGIIDYLWTFEDCGTPVRLWGCTACYVFSTIGSYVVSLTVTDSGGLNASDQMCVYVESMPWPGLIEAGPNQTVAVGEAVTFNGSASDVYVPTAYCEWMLVVDSPVILSGMVANYTFNKTGTYVVILTIKDEWMNPLGSDSLTVQVTGPGGRLPMAEAGADETISSGTWFRFNGSGSVGDIADMGYIWKFRYNGTWELMFGQKPMFHFVTPGRYVITLTVMDAEARSDNDTVTIAVLGTQASSNPIPDSVIWLVIGSSEAALVALALFIVLRRH